MWYLDKKLWLKVFALAAAIALVVYKNQELADAIDALGEIVLRAIGG